MSRSRFGNSVFGAISLTLLPLLLLHAATPRAAAEGRSSTFGESYIPLVYPVRDTAAHDRAPDFPSFARLPIVRPLPDPFLFPDGRRSTSFASWERHRAYFMAAIEKYEIGPVPSCSRCTITAHYTPPAPPGNTGTLTVTVSREGRTITLTSGVYIPGSSGFRVGKS
jgi:hypothetical protein